MRILQVWARTFISSLAILTAVYVAVPAMRQACTSIAFALSPVAGILIVAVVIRRSLLERRLARAIAARRTDEPQTPRDVLERAFGPLVESGMITDLSAALILPGNEVVHFAPAGGDERGSKLYEVGSLTKPMTAELLASTILDGRAELTTRLADVFSTRALSPEIAEITFGELVTHQSGLPRLPRSFRMVLAARFSSDPYRRISMEALLDAVASARRTTPRGTYSNFGFAVLGAAVAELTGTDYANALESSVLEPLGLENTYVDSGDELHRRFARGRDAIGVPTPRWHMPSFASAGGVSMTIDDGVQWLAAHVNPPSGFSDVVTMVTRPLATLGADRIGMGWIVRETTAGAVVWHNGGTGGFSSFAAFDQRRAIGVIAFAASASTGDLDRAGFEVIDRLLPLFLRQREVLRDAVAE